MLKPVSFTAVSGTPWCVVWTDKGTVFYFNPSTKTSVWERPLELKGRADVDELEKTNPNATNNNDSSSASSAMQSATNETAQDSGPSEKKVRKSSPPSTSSSFIEPGTSKTTETTTTSTTTSSASSLDYSKPFPTISSNLTTQSKSKKDGPTEIEAEAMKKRDTIPVEERIQTFCQMLEEKNVDTSSTFQRELSKIVFDPRYLLLTSVERRETFEKYCLEKSEEERRNRKMKLKKATDDFKELLIEAHLTPKSTLVDFLEKYSLDPRLKSLSTKDREILFGNHIDWLVRKEHDERRRSSSSERRLVCSTSYDRSSRERYQPPIPTTIDRYRRDDRVRPQPLSKEEAENIFMALLTEFITDTEIEWPDAKRILRKSPQYHLLDNLSREWMYGAFDKHCERLFKRRRDKFHQLLAETKEITLSSEWRDVRRIIREDPRYIKFSSSDRKCEREFKYFIKDKIAQAISDFRQLLKETKLIDRNTRKTIESSDSQHLIDIIKTLQNDSRFRDLETLSSERRKVLLSYIEEVAASNDSNRESASREDKVVES